jgi:hypothetical protein
MNIEEVLLETDRQDEDVIDTLEEFIQYYRIDATTDINIGSNKYDIKIMDGYGGEGKGEDYWVVFSITINKDETTQKIYMVNGEYYSYEGSTLYWHNVKEVECVKVVVDKWREKK